VVSTGTLCYRIEERDTDLFRGEKRFEDAFHDIFLYAFTGTANSDAHGPQREMRIPIQSMKDKFLIIKNT
jgi:hypothetical protein